MFIKEIFKQLLEYRVPILVGIISFSLGVGGTWLYSSPYNDILKRELSRYDDGTWVVKMGGNEIGQDYVNKRMKLYKEHIIKDAALTDPLMQDKILRKLIDNYLVLMAAKNSRIFEQERAQDYLWIILEEAMVNYYLDLLASVKGGKKIQLKDKEVEDFYNKKKEMFDKKRIPKKQALAIIRKEINSLNERYRKQNRLVARKIELGKMKKDLKITINKELLQKDLTANKKAPDIDEKVAPEIQVSPEQEGM